MMRLAVLTVLSLVLVQSQARHLLETVEEKPWFCHDLDCPKYKVENSTNSYEVRRYETGTWAYTEVESLLYSVGVTEGFKKLFDYISGKNEGAIKIAMTSPVLVNVKPGDGPFCKSTYAVAFFVPFKYQDNPPVPTDPKVHLVNKKSTASVAVLQYGGYVFDDWSVSAKANKLKDALEANNVLYDNSSFFTAGYDPPTRLQHRHNEVWIKLKPAADKVEATS